VRKIPSVQWVLGGGLCWASVGCLLYLTTPTITF
jgi:hypothetical protein